jgi:hypothetical protein
MTRCANNDLSHLFVHAVIVGVVELCVPCVCRKLLLYLGLIHLEGLGLNGVAGGNLKQNILYVILNFLCVYATLDVLILLFRLTIA